MEIVAPPVVAANGIKVDYHGREHIPDHGGAVVALNHTSYVDWLPASLAAYQRRRRLRFVIKAEMTEVRAVSYVIKHAKLIPVDRRVGADDYAVAVQRLKEGELIGIHPEATISRSFELRPFKTGAARLAQEDYPHPEGAYRVPRRVGGSAPSPEESRRLRAIELAERARNQKMSSR